MSKYFNPFTVLISVIWISAAIASFAAPEHAMSAALCATIVIGVGYAISKD